MTKEFQKGEFFGAQSEKPDMRHEKGLHNYTKGANKYKPEKEYDQKGILEDLPDPSNFEPSETPDYEFFNDDGSEIKKELSDSETAKQNESDEKKAELKVKRSIDEVFEKTDVVKTRNQKLDPENKILMSRPKGEFVKGLKWQIGDQYVSKYKSSTRNRGRDANFKAISEDKLPRLFRKILEKFKRKEIQSDRSPKEYDVLESVSPSDADE